MVEPALFGFVDELLAPVIEWLVLVLVLANLATRGLAHRSHVGQSRSEDSSIARHPIHESLNVVLVLASFYYATVHYHAGMVLSVLVLGMFITDLFEFEARKVEERTDKPIELPKGSLVASVLVALYALYLNLFFVIEPIWNAIV